MSSRFSWTNALTPCDCIFSNGKVWNVFLWQRRAVLNTKCFNVWANKMGCAGGLHLRLLKTLVKPLSYPFRVGGERIRRKEKEKKTTTLAVLQRLLECCNCIQLSVTRQKNMCQWRCNMKLLQTAVTTRTDCARLCKIRII